jgi:hypothetical protein
MSQPGGRGAAAWAVGLSLLATAATAQTVPIAAAIEGPITDIQVNGDGSGTITVMSVLVQVPSGTPITTPTAKGLSLQDLAYGPLPGRSAAGFLGGTAIIDGTSLNGVFTASAVFSDLFENVVLGAITDPDGDPQTVHLQGMLLLPSSDPRMPAGAPRNGFGFAIDVTSIAVGALTAAEGYYSEDDAALYWHTLESDGGELLRPDVPEVSILRAQCRDRGAGNRDELAVSGAVHTPAAGPVRIQRRTPANGWANVATVIAVVDAELPQFGSYRLSRTNLNLPGCPTLVRAQFLHPTTNAVLATAEAAPETR